MKNVEEQQWIERRRAAHHKALEVLALGVGCKTPGRELWRKLNRLERELYRVVEDYSNGANGVGVHGWEIANEQGRLKLKAIFGGNIPEGVFLNSDPRGHVLKLDCDERTIPDGMERDWGGNGILAATIE